MNVVRKNSGMSLLELVAVMAVIAILAGISFAVLDGVKDRSMRSETEAELAAIRGVLESYRMEYGSYPVISSGASESCSISLFNALSGLKAPDGSSISDDPLFNAKNFSLDESGSFFVDGWGSPLFYAYDSDWLHGQYFLLSTGADGVANLPGGSGTYEPGADENLDNLEGLDP